MPKCDDQETSTQLLFLLQDLPSEITFHAFKPQQQKTLYTNHKTNKLHVYVAWMALIS